MKKRREMFPDYSFYSPHLLWFLLLIPVSIAVYAWINIKRNSALKTSSLLFFSEYKPTFRQYLQHLPFIFWCLAFISVIVAIARPQSSSGGQQVTTEGIDIVMALDISASMLAEDLKPNRIEAAKKVAEQFIDARPNDRIGLVIFSGESFTQCPLTTDHSILKNLFSGLKSGMLADGTAIGEGLATAVNRIKESRAKSKVIILLTDGVNNIGEISPQTAGDIAKLFGIRVYTIGVGTTGLAPYPVPTPFGLQYQNLEVKIDEQVLKDISNTTGGKYFRATNTAKLKDIYSEIDQLEKTKIAVTEFRHKSEKFYPFLLLAIILLAVERILRYTVLKSIP